MREKRLLERLRDQEREPGRRGSGSPGEAAASILRHVGRILNTRQGSASIAPDFGIPDFTDLATSFSPDSIPEIEETLRQIISKYEPRLGEVKVAFAPRDGDHSVITFKLEGRMLSGETNLPVVFETLLTADGRLRVREAAR